MIAVGNWRIGESSVRFISWGLLKSQKMTVRCVFLLIKALVSCDHTNTTKLGRYYCNIVDLRYQILVCFPV